MTVTYTSNVATCRGFGCFWKLLFSSRFVAVRKLTRAGFNWWSAVFVTSVSAASGAETEGSAAGKVMQLTFMPVVKIRDSHVRRGYVSVGHQSPQGGLRGIRSMAHSFRSSPYLVAANLLLTFAPSKPFLLRSLHVTNYRSKRTGCCWFALPRWHGSVSVIILFEKVSVYCQYFSDLIPLSFVLGFYVSIVVQRWWEQYMSLPWPDSLALFVSTSMHGLVGARCSPTVISGDDERSRLMRRTVMRYVNLTEIITFIMISPGVKKRFPTLEHLVEAGILTSNEQKIFDDLNAKTSHSKYWMPLVWAGSIIARARKEGRIRDDFAVKTMLDEINRFRGLCGGLLSYDWISIPLVYTQVVTLAVYSFFIAAIMGRQFLDPAQKIPNHEVDFYVPVFTLLQFFFYMGWLKVAESLVNPFGEDDDDFEINWLVDRNLQVSYLIVDEMHSEHPELIQDMYWDEVFPQELPYTIAAEQFRREPPQGSTANIEVSEQDQEFLPMVEEEEDEGIHDSISGINDVSVNTSINLKDHICEYITYIPELGTSSPPYLRTTKRGAEVRMSSASVRHGRRPRSLKRSGSRVSSASQDSAIFRMSGLSLNTHGGEDITSPRSKTRHNSCGDDDEHIVIKIKRRDNDGHVITSHTPDDFDSTSDSGKALLIGKQKRPGASSIFREGTEEEPFINSEKVKGLPDNKSLGSSASIRTSIFHGDGPEIDNGEEEKRELLTQKQGRSMTNMNLKGLSKTISVPSRSQQEQPSSSLSFHRLSSETIEKRVSQSEQLLSEDDSFLPDLQRQDETSTSEPVSPSHKSPVLQSMASKSLAAFDAPVEKDKKSSTHPTTSPFEADESMLYKPFSGDLSVCLEEASPKASSSEGKFSYMKPEPGSVFQSSPDQQVVPKDTLETIIEGPLESIAEVEHVEERESYKCDTNEKKKKKKNKVVNNATSPAWLTCGLGAFVLLP
ncbi:Bestrophin-3 [Portunus trituberculatus]|uniref:Bestrophin-3 n=1 Tax=Portunus trituberculatus TaxID=210409 RepID=A0A5B7D3V8_PORTR|nr:Bestrophin-3 [Portunus trituberculatus]